MPGHNGLQPIIESSLTSIGLSLHVNPCRKNPTENAQEYPGILLQHEHFGRQDRPQCLWKSFWTATVFGGTGLTKLFALSNQKEWQKTSFFWVHQQTTEKNHAVTIKTRPRSSFGHSLFHVFSMSWMTWTHFSAPLLPTLWPRGRLRNIPFLLFSWGQR